LHRSAQQADRADANPRGDGRRQGLPSRDASASLNGGGADLFYVWRKAHAPIQSGATAHGISRM